jgi:hypothetical protein
MSSASKELLLQALHACKLGVKLLGRPQKFSGRSELLVLIPAALFVAERYC